VLLAARRSSRALCGAFGNRATSGDDEAMKETVWVGRRGKPSAIIARFLGVCPPPSLSLSLSRSNATCASWISCCFESASSKPRPIRVSAFRTRAAIYPVVTGTRLSFNVRRTNRRETRRGRICIQISIGLTGRYLRARRHTSSTTHAGVSPFAELEEINFCGPSWNER